MGPSDVLTVGVEAGAIGRRIVGFSGREKERRATLTSEIGR
jgi:hypothetical protein